VYADAIGVDQFVEVFLFIMDFLSVKIDHAFTVVDNIDDISYVPIENAQVIVVSDLHDPVAHGIGNFPRTSFFP